MKALHFGAGNIGRGFIGQILRENDYLLTFADINQDLINRLKEEKKYKVILAGEDKKQILIDGIDAINSELEEEKLRDCIQEVDIITTAVGPNIIKFIAKTLVPGIKKRLASNSIKPLNIIACENAINATDILKSNLFTYLEEEEIEKAEKYIGFPNSAVDRIVPIQFNENPLDVMVEPFFEWVIEEDKLVGDFPKLKEVHYVNDLKPYIERKLFTVNTGHASTAYTGKIYGHNTIVDAIEDERVENIVKGVLKETSIYLVNNYGFDRESHREYVKRILNRFRNPNISDDLNRVARSPIRKISPEERLVYPARKLIDMEVEPEYLSKVISFALKFYNEDDIESVELRNYLETQGLQKTLKNYSDLDKGSPLARLIERYYYEF